MTRRSNKPGRTTQAPAAAPAEERPLRGRTWRAWFVIIAAILLVLSLAGSLLQIIFS